MSHDHDTDDRPFGDYGRDYWNERYSGVEGTWSGRPNPLLVREVAGLTPGTALDLGAGEGGDAIWLAQQGWRVDAADISAVGLQRASSHAAGAGEDIASRIRWVEADLRTWAPDPDRYDLVSTQYLHVLRSELDGVLARAAAAVRPGGGRLLVVGHSVPDPGAEHEHIEAERFFTVADVLGVPALREWEVLVQDHRVRRTPDQHVGPGHEFDTVVHLRRP